MINDLPTLFEVASGRKAVKDKPSMDSGSKSRNSSKVKWSSFPKLQFLFYCMPFPLSENFRTTTNFIIAEVTRWVN